MEFTQHVILLILAAVLTTFLIPLIFRWIDQPREERQKNREHRKNLEQKRFEADLARQSKIIDAQVALLDDISQQFWRFRYLAMSVSFYNPYVNPERYQEVVKTYDLESWDLFNHIRESVSKSRRLISENAYQKLVEFYEKKIVSLDREKVNQVIQTSKGHHELNLYIFHEFTPDIDNIIYFLSEELQLTSKQKSKS